MKGYFSDNIAVVWDDGLVMNYSKTSPSKYENNLNFLPESVSDSQYFYDKTENSHLKLH